MDSKESKVSKLVISMAVVAVLGVFGGRGEVPGETDFAALQKTDSVTIPTEAASRQNPLKNSADSLSVRHTPTPTTTSGYHVSKATSLRGTSAHTRGVAAKGRGKKAHQATPPIPTAVDNSYALLAAADSLARTNTFFSDSENRYMYLPIVFVRYQNVDSVHIRMPEWNGGYESKQLDYDKRWYDQLAWNSWFEKYHMKRIIVDTPWLVPYNISMLPEPPKEYEVTPDVKRNTLVIREREMKMPTAAPDREIRQRNWIHSFNASLQFSQLYLSGNWYQGGTKNVNMIGNAYYNLRLNQALHPNLLFEFTGQYKLGVNSAPDDKLRGYAINEDLLQLNAKFGLRATKQFYYSMNMQFKTQVLNSYQTNTETLKSAFLSPGEYNAGIGMTYSISNSRKTLVFDASLSPLAYNMKICKDIKNFDPTAFGIEAGKHLDHQFGSSGECRMTWQIFPNVSFNTRLFAFTDYSYVQGDLEGTLNVSINKFLSTQIYARLRYDDSAQRDPAWDYWQFREVFSFGLQYRFGM